MLGVSTLIDAMLRRAITSLGETMNKALNTQCDIANPGGCVAPKTTPKATKDVVDEELRALGFEVLREDLKLAGVDRALLFSDASNVVPMRFHDLRATFCTWARRQGKSDYWICERSGHKPTGAMIERYTRQAITLADLNYESFPDVKDAIPELPSKR